MKLELLSLPLVLVYELLLVVNLLAALSLCVSEFLHLEVLDSALALGDHLSDRFSLHVFLIEVLVIVLLLAHLVFLKLILDRLCTLQLADIHVVASILHVFASLLLAFEGGIATLALLLFTILGLDLLLSHT